MRQNRQVWILGIISLAMIAGGCQHGQVQGDRAALMSQNRELQNRLSQTQAALDAAEAHRMRLIDEMELLRYELANVPAPQAAAPVTSGFSSIDGVETIHGVGTVTVRVPGDVLFESGKVDLKPAALRTLEQIASVIQREYSRNVIRVEGHTDSDPIRRSKWVDNLELSLQRAAAVHRHLASQGISGNRMYAAGFGEHRPRSTKPLSRRVEIVVVLND